MFAGLLLALVEEPEEPEGEQSEETDAEASAEGPVETPATEPVEAQDNQDDEAWSTYNKTPAFSRRFAF